MPSTNMLLLNPSLAAVCSWVYDPDLMIEAPDVDGCSEGALLSGATWRIMGTCVCVAEAIPAACKSVKVAGSQGSGAFSAAVAIASCRGLTCGVSPGAAGPVSKGSKDEAHLHRDFEKCGDLCTSCCLLVVKLRPSTKQSAF